MAKGRPIAPLPSRGDSVLDEIIGGGLPPARPERNAGANLARQAPANLQIEDLPDPVDVGDKDGDLDKTEAELLSMCDRAVVEYARAEAVALKALLNVQQRRLYRAEFATFEEYAEHRLSYSRQWAYRQLDRYQVSQILSPMGDKLLPERQARELAPVLRDNGPDAVKQIWEASVEASAGKDGEKTGVVTGAVLKRVRQQLYPTMSAVSVLPRQAAASLPASRYVEPVAALAAAASSDTRDPLAVAEDLATQLKAALPADVFAALKTID